MIDFGRVGAERKGERHFSRFQADRGAKVGFHPKTLRS